MPETPQNKAPEITENPATDTPEEDVFLDADDAPIALSYDDMRAKVKGERKKKPAITPSDAGQSVGIGLAVAGPVAAFVFIAGAAASGVGLAALAALVAVFAISMGARLIMRHRNEQAAIERETQKALKEQEKEQAKYRERAKDKSEQKALEEKIDANAQEIEGLKGELQKAQAKAANAQTAAPDPRVGQLQQQLQNLQQQQAQNVGNLAVGHQQQLQQMQQQLNQQQQQMQRLQAQQAQRPMPAVQPAPQMHRVPPVQHMAPPLQVVRVVPQQAQIHNPVGRLGQAVLSPAMPQAQRVQVEDVMPPVQNAVLLDDFREQTIEILRRHRELLSGLRAENEELREGYRAVEARLQNLKESMERQEVGQHFAISDLQDAQRLLKAEQAVLAERQAAAELVRSLDALEQQGRMERVEGSVSRLQNDQEALLEQAARIIAQHEQDIARLEGQAQHDRDEVRARLEAAKKSRTALHEARREAEQALIRLDEQHRVLAGSVEEVRDDLDFDLSQRTAQLHHRMDWQAEQLDQLGDEQRQLSGRLDRAQDRLERVEGRQDVQADELEYVTEGFHEQQHTSRQLVGALSEFGDVVGEAIDTLEDRQNALEKEHKGLQKAFKIDQRARYSDEELQKLSMFTRSALTEIRLAHNTTRPIEELVQTTALGEKDPYRAIVGSDDFNALPRNAQLAMLEEMVMHNEVGSWRANPAYSVPADPENPQRAEVLNAIVKDVLDALPQEIANADRHLLAKVAVRYMEAFEQDGLDIDAIDDDARSDIVDAVMSHLVQGKEFPKRERASFSSVLKEMVGGWWFKKSEENPLMQNLLMHAIMAPEALRQQPLAQDIADAMQFLDPIGQEEGLPPGLREQVQHINGLKEISIDDDLPPQASSSTVSHVQQQKDRQRKSGASPEVAP